MRRLKIFAVMAAAILVLLLLLLYPLLYTNWGLQLVYSAVRSDIPATVSIDRIDGSLGGKIHLQGIRFEDDMTRIDIGELQARLGLVSLSASVVNVKELIINDVDIVQKAVTGEKTAVAEENNDAPPDLSGIRLPLGFRLGNMLVNDVNISRVDGEPVIFDRLQARAHSSLQTVHIDQLDISMPELNLKLDGTVKAVPELDSRLNLVWSGTQNAQHEMAGKGSISGNIHRLALEHESSGVVISQLQADLINPLHAASLNGSINIAAVDFQALGMQEHITQLKGRIKANGDLSAFRLSMSLDQSLPVIGQIKTDASISKQDSEWQITQLELKSATADRPLELTAKANISLGEQGAYAFTRQNIRHMQINAGWRNLGWPLTTGDVVSSKQGTLTLAGQAQAYDYHVRGQLQGRHIPAGDIVSRGKGSLAGLDIDSFDANVLGGQLLGKGRYQWLPHQGWELDLQAAGVDPSLKWEKYPGRMDISLKSTGEYRDGIYKNTMDLSNLKGKFLGHDVKAVANVDIDAKRYSVDKLEIRSGDSTLSMQGSLGENWALKTSMQIQALSGFLPDAQGKLGLDAEISGPRRQPAVSATVNAGKLIYNRNRLDQLQLKASVDMSDRQSSSIELNARDADFNGRTVDTIQFNAKGRLRDHQIGMFLVSSAANAELSMQAGLHDEVWRGSLLQSNFQHADTGRWELKDSVEFKLEDRQLALSNACWGREQASICINAGSDSQQAVYGLQVDNLPMDALQPFIANSIEFKGSLQATASASLPLADMSLPSLTFDSKLQWSAGRISYLDKDGIRRVVDHDGGVTNVSLDKAGLNASLDWQLGHKGRLDASAALPAWRPGMARQDQAIKARMALELPDLSFIPSFVRNMGETTGSASADLELNGSVKQPVLTGRLAVENGRVELPQIGIIVDKLSARLDSTDGDIIRLHGKAVSGGGHINIDGTATLPGLSPDEELVQHRPLASSIAVTGKDFEVVNLSEANVFVSPDLLLQFSGDRLDLLGVLTIPRARINPKDVSDTIQPSGDVILVGQEHQQQKKKIRIYSSVRIEAGDDVKFSGYGIDAFLEGAVVAFDDPDKETTGYGEIRIRDGKYTVYNEVLVLETGRLSYNGNLITNPNINVRAVKRLPDIVVGVNVGGTLVTPVINLFSEPLKKDEDILSYLILGVPAGDASSEGAKKALLARALKQLTDKRDLGVDEFRLESSDSGDQTSVVIGKYFSPRLYVNYSVISGAVNVLRLRYKIGSKWLLQSESGENRSADFLYTYEH